MKFSNKLEKIFQKYENQKGNLIPIMQNIQEIEGFLSKESIKLIAKKTGISVAEIYGVATFYSLFRLKPQGKHIIRVCQGTACHVGNSKDILRAVREKLNLNETDETTAYNEFTIMEVACLGCCSLAPVIMIDDKTYGKLTPNSVKKIIDNYDK